MTEQSCDEVIGVLVVFVFVVGIMAAYYLVFLGIPAVLTGNYWYSENQVLRALKAEHPGITEILNTKRKVFALSVIIVKENGKRHDYCLDSNILQDYRFSECPKTDKK